ncbi:hypothetical protein LX32DRAFT_101833 [Colletotrichum zoysiae]|uniref:Uncharacterized protein n=1 Tax=Colletotrichum zoysiae TaxID=1216348 RepID=A0AAD9LX70_9PEZI|nr:hypothetical protein LX32DRAFT_101833 [Colletotrichum zoysiae]
MHPPSQPPAAHRPELHLSSTDPSGVGTEITLHMLGWWRCVLQVTRGHVPEAVLCCVVRPRPEGASREAWGRDDTGGGPPSMRIKGELWTGSRSDSAFRGHRLRTGDLVSFPALALSLTLSLSLSLCRSLSVALSLSLSLDFCSCVSSSTSFR